MPESIGHKLKAARESRRLTLEQAADITRIRSVYLQALENDDYSVMLSAAQGRGFLRIYAEFLGLNLDELTTAARESRPAASSASIADSTPLADSTPEAVPTPEAKPSRPGFWARLLRREPPVKEEPKAVEEPAPAPAPLPVPITPVAVEEEEPVKTRKAPKKPSRKTATATEEKPKSATRRSAAGKKKRTMSRSSKR